MAVLVFRHGPSEPLGRLADALDSRAMEWRYVDLWQTPDGNLAVDQAQAVVSMGGPMSVNDPLPWLRLEEHYLIRAISSAIPVLGICLGGQLLAKCLGSEVKPMQRKEIGWHPIRLREAARIDPLFAGLQPVLTTFQWHGDTFELPAGSAWLAESELCPHQAFRSGSSLYGLQFHPEVTPEIISSWCREDDACGDQREATGPIDPEACQTHMREVADHLFGRWCELVATR
jgi:GMP synthase-like glutamine amidotransferase